MTTADRVEALRAVIDLDGPIDDVIGRLRSFPWDSAVELVVLEPEHVIRILERYLRVTLDPTELEKWAAAIEGRDDVGYGSEHQTILKQVVFELANPLLTQQIGPERALEWKEQLKNLTNPKT